MLKPVIESGKNTQWVKKKKGIQGKFICMGSAIKNYKSEHPLDSKYELECKYVLNSYVTRE